MNNLSQTQLANFASVAGLLVIVLQQFGVILEQDKVAFAMAALWTLGWNAYNFYQRYQRGDLTLGGVRK
jgi:hypothetical protein